MYLCKLVLPVVIETTSDSYKPSAITSQLREHLLLLTLLLYDSSYKGRKSLGLKVF